MHRLLEAKDKTQGSSAQIEDEIISVCVENGKIPEHAMCAHVTGKPVTHVTPTVASCIPIYIYIYNEHTSL